MEGARTEVALKNRFAMKSSSSAGVAINETLFVAIIRVLFVESPEVRIAIVGVFASSIRSRSNALE